MAARLRKLIITGLGCLAEWNSIKLGESLGRISFEVTRLRQIIAPAHCIKRLT